MSGEQKFKEGDEILEEAECSNKDELLVFTTKHQVYKAKVDDFPDTKASVLGEDLPSKLDMEEGEDVVYVAVVSEYKRLYDFRL
jgi:DNA gyrase subunit A